MKRIALLLTGTICFLQANAQREEPYLTRSFANETVRSASVETSGGSIQVNGVDAAESRIEVFVRPSNSNHKYSKEEIRKKIEEEYILDIGVSGGKLVAIAKRRSKLFNGNRGLSISFKVYVPHNVSTNLATSGGSIRLADLSGTHDFRTSGGSLDVERLEGTITGRTSGGSIRIAHSKNDIDLRTSGGSIHAESCSGNLYLATSGGSLRLSGLEGKIKANTSGGSVHGNGISGEIRTQTSGGSIGLKAMSGSVYAATSGGNIDVELKSWGQYLTLQNSGGSIRMTMPANEGLDLTLIGERIDTGPLKNFSGTMKKTKVEGTLNGGGIPVKAVTSGGGVHVAWKN